MIMNRSPLTVEEQALFQELNCSDIEDAKNKLIQMKNDLSNEDVIFEEVISGLLEKLPEINFSNERNMINPLV